MMETFSGMDYLRIDIASSFGLDKVSWRKRLDWAAANEADLESLLREAEEPALYYAGVQAYRLAQRGEAVGYPVSLDATASGLQILSVLTGDRMAAAMCNVVDTGDRQDAYTLIYDAMVTKLGGTAKIKRDDVKEAIMTSLYGSTAVPKEVFGEGDLLTCFHETMGLCAPAVWELNKVMLDIWNPNALSHDWVLPDNFHVHVKVMDLVRETVHFLNEPFEVTRKVNRPVENGRSLGANTVHSIDGMIVREMARRCMFDPEVVAKVSSLVHGKQPPGGWGKSSSSPDDEMVARLWGHRTDSGYLSARILDHLNADNAGLVDLEEINGLLASLPARPFRLMAVHDCFRCLPNRADELRRQYNLQLHLVAESNMLGFVVGQILGQPLVTGKLDPTLGQDVMAANYALS